MKQLDNKQILDHASAKAQLKKTLKDIFQAWPNLQQITLRLVGFMGIVLPSDKNMPLLESCLINAVNGYRGVTPIEYATEAQMVSYIRGLLADVDQIVKVSIGTLHDDPVLWEPLVDDLLTFEKQHEGNIKVYDHPYSEVKPNSMRLMILSRIITTRDLYWIDRYSTLPKLLGEAG